MNPCQKTGTTSCGKQPDCFQQVVYYPGQFLTDKVLNADRAYLAAKRRLHNRGLHGSGIVCGLELQITDRENGKAVVRHGLALDQFGREIYVPEDVPVDLLAKLRECGSLARAECGQTTPVVAREASRLAGATDQKQRGFTNAFGALFEAMADYPVAVVALRYEEYPIEPEPAFLPQAGCETSCAHSRVQEGYHIEVKCLQELCEDCQQNLFWPMDLARHAKNPMACDFSCEEKGCPWVFLGLVFLTPRGAELQLTLNRLVRRPVITGSLALFYTWPLFVKGRTGGTMQLLRTEQFAQRVYSDETMKEMSDQGIQVRSVERIAPGSGLGEDEESDAGVTLYVDEYDRILFAMPATEEVGMRQELANMRGALDVFTSGSFRMAQRAAEKKVPAMQEPLAGVMTAKLAETVPIGDVAELKPYAAELAKLKVTTLAGAINDWGRVAKELGSDKSAAVLKAAEGAYASLAKKAAAATAETGAVDAGGLADKAGVVAKHLKVAPDRAAKLIKGIGRVMLK